ACGRGYLRAADVSSFCTLADGVVVQMIRCTNNGRFLVVLWVCSDPGQFVLSWQVVKLQRGERKQLRSRAVPLLRLLDHLVGLEKERRGKGQSECLRGFEVNDQFVLRRQLDRQVGGLAL